MTEKKYYGDVLLRPLITEKTVASGELNKYIFEVHRDANKQTVKDAVEKLFNVKVKQVNIMNMKGKPKKRGVFVGKSRSWKKAIVTLVTGYRIKELEGQH
ncbi:50S ribosomal protein L23 [Mesotoga sp. Brook.08.YT.4.2.5.1]|uniref:50S ribosomal protein L23 n=1 Tax=unclassified Mesotoga TaxID=1184398 RepID=UPI000C18E57E|nr:MULTISPECIES: 50S ribosomal protein L23 [unclassified Mesotoga]PNE23063.1 50S ribosomal protein L23 [Mesotoga sp. Brook.08.YT.4.2.5.1]PNS42012.1 50S ribosomal protein L23 [Mesotoga sp. B105.6.4]PVD15867.1 50S ribosomal protein L23 [Mesotoga sp. Brook.08.105.5.1]RAO97887.1 50S ribosomal protein L23 [Mesotoga sp. Brook.08.YT.4.2.5.4.]RDI93891.1 50S ribosomal protein L23 [Mesotoga sp. Brook.08.YT.4.2.5.2.]